MANKLPGKARVSCPLGELTGFNPHLGSAACMCIAKVHCWLGLPEQATRRLANQPTNKLLNNTALGQSRVKISDQAGRFLIIVRADRLSRRASQSAGATMRQNGQASLLDGELGGVSKASRVVAAKLMSVRLLF